jgi:hypothetical protein
MILHTDRSSGIDVLVILANDLTMLRSRHELPIYVAFSIINLKCLEPFLNLLERTNGCSNGIFLIRLSKDFLCVSKRRA